MSSSTTNLGLKKVDLTDKVVDTWADYNTNMNTLDSQVSGKQAELVSGTNIKTINGESLLGSGNINIQSGSTNYDELINKPIINLDTITLTNGSFTLEQGFYNIKKLILNGSESAIYANSIIYVDKTSSTSGAYYYINRIGGGGTYLVDNKHYYIRYTTSSGAYISTSATYTLPTASTTTLGGVKLDGTTITADNNGVISAIGGGGGVQSDDVTNIVVSSTDIGTGATLTNGTLYLVYEE